MPKKFELKANTKNLLSDCVGRIKDLLSLKRGAKVFHDFDDTFVYFQERVHIPPELWQINSDGEIKWRQAIRNAAKVHREKKTPDALTQGELMALEHGGFALPDHVPDDRKVVKFPDIGGFKIKTVKKNAKSHKVVVDAASAVMRVLDLVPKARRVEVLQFVANEFDCEVH